MRVFSISVLLLFAPAASDEWMRESELGLAGSREKWEHFTCSMCDEARMRGFPKMTVREKEVAAARAFWKDLRADRPSCGLRNLTAAMPPGSGALHEYLERVYGATSVAAARAWRWERVEFVWEHHLPRAVRGACLRSWPCDPIGARSVYRAHGSVEVLPQGSLWVYSRTAVGRDSPLMPPGVALAIPPWKAPADAGAVWTVGGAHEVLLAETATRAVVLWDAGWHEVTHVDKPAGDEPEGLWMFSAAGSGLSCRLGRTLVGARPRQIWAHLHDGDTTCATVEGGCAALHKRDVFAEAQRQGFETIAYTFHGEATTPVPMIEIIRLGFDVRTPDWSGVLAWGWAAAGGACQRDPRFEHVECLRGAVEGAPPSVASSVASASAATAASASTRASNSVAAFFTAVVVLASVASVCAGLGLVVRLVGGDCGGALGSSDVHVR